MLGEGMQVGGRFTEEGSCGALSVLGGFFPNVVTRPGFSLPVWLQSRVFFWGGEKTALFSLCWFCGALGVLGGFSLTEFFGQVFPSQFDWRSALRGGV